MTGCVRRAVGDLAYQVKKMRQKGSHFSETTVMQWFVQLCLALEYIHKRKILHRDLKSQNVFLTRNFTIKLGDFGISKVLENTNDQALTVQGTPYYMSPEVCQSKPYNYTSDVWSLGCILYELCTLQHAFSGENLLGLVFKIVQDKQGPIPDMYSQDMKDLVQKLLVKDEKKRPQVIDILRMPFVKKHMVSFVQSQGKMNLDFQFTARADIQPKAINKLKQKDESELTAADRVKLRKEQRALAEFEQLKKAAAEAHLTKNIGRELEMQQFKGTNPAGLLSNAHRAAGTGTQQQLLMGTVKGGESTMGSDFDANNRTMGVSGSNHSATLQRSVQEHLPGKMPTEYDKPWVSKQQIAQQATKDYLRDTAQIQIDFGGAEEEQELPSSA